MNTNNDLVKDAATKLCEKHGGVRAAGRATGINYAYLSRLTLGGPCRPTDEVLAVLGLERIETIRKIRGRK